MEGNKEPDQVPSEIKLLDKDILLKELRKKRKDVQVAIEAQIETVIDSEIKNSNLLKLRADQSESSRPYDLVKRWWGVIFKYLLTATLVILITIGNIHLGRAGIDIKFIRLMYDVYASFVTIGFFHSNIDSILNARIAEYSNAERKVVFKKSTEKYVFGKKYLITEFLFYLTFRIIKTIFGLQLVYVHPMLFHSEVYEAWLCWILIYFFVLIFSGKSEVEAEDDDGTDSKVKGYKDIYDRYQKDLEFRKNYMNEVTKKLRRREETVKQKKIYYQKMNKHQMEFIEEDIIEAKKDTPRGSLRLITGFTNVTKLAQTTAGIDGVSSRATSHDWTPGQFLTGSLYCIMPFILDTVLYIFGYYYNDISSFYILLILYFLVLMVPFLLTFLMGAVNLLFPLQNVNLVRMMTEIVQYIHFMLLARIPVNLKSSISIVVFLAIFLLTICITRLFLNVPALRFFFTWENLFGNKKKEEEKFTRLSEGEMQEKIVEFLENNSVLSYGVGFVFICWFTTAIFAACLLIIRAIEPSIVVNEYNNVELVDTLIYTSCILTLLLILFLYNLYWVNMNIRRGVLKGINLGELSVNFVEKVWGMYNWYIAWFIIRFSIRLNY